MAPCPPIGSLDAGVCPACGTVRLTEDDESILCPACGWRPIYLSDDLYGPGDEDDMPLRPEGPGRGGM